MKIFDFNIHLPDMAFDDVNQRVHSEMIASHSQLIERAEKYYPLEKVEGGNFMIFNPRFYQEEDQFNAHFRSKLNQSAFTLLIDFRSPDVFDDIDKGIVAGINCIKFHSYNQQIESSHYETIIKICKYAESKNLIICLDASYGTKYD